jgi:hypothetical protein
MNLRTHPYDRSSPGQITAVYLTALLAIVFLAGCGKEARVVNRVKEIPLVGGRDTVYFERSEYWDRSRSIAWIDSNRQLITFRPPAGTVAYVTLQNMGGVPLKRDTIRALRQVSAEQYLRTGTQDTNMHLHIDFPDYRKPSTDVIIFIRNRDSIYREILFR